MAPRIVFVAQNFEKVPSQVEAELRKELGLTQPIPFTTENMEADRSSHRGEAATAMLRVIGGAVFDQFASAIPVKSFGNALGAMALEGVSEVVQFKGKQNPLPAGDIRFDIPRPRPAALYAQVFRIGTLLLVGRIIYSTTISKHVDKEVIIEKGIKEPKMSGDVKICQRLVDNTELLKKIDKFNRSTFSSLAGQKAFSFKVSLQPFFRIIPQGQNSLVVVQTLPVTSNFVWTRPYRLNAEEFFGIVETLSAWL